MPPLDFIPELMDIYPEAKVVLVTRDPERWLESIRPVAANSSLWYAFSVNILDFDHLVKNSEFPSTHIPKSQLYYGSRD